MTASPRAFSVSPRVLAGAGHCKQVALASPPETFLPRAAFLLRACRHKHPLSLWFAGPPAACGWPSGALVTVTQLLTTFTLIRRPPHGSRCFIRSIQCPLQATATNHLCTPGGVLLGPPSSTSALGLGDLRRGGMITLPAAAGSTLRRGYSLSTAMAAACGAVIHLGHENSSLYRNPGGRGGGRRVCPPRRPKRQEEKERRE